MTRYAIYFVPDRNSKLWAFGSSVIGYDSHTGKDVSFPDDPLFAGEEMRGWTDSPRTYGFHATLKAPFELAENVTEAELLEAADRFERGREPVELGGLTVAEMGGFIGLVPKEPCQELDSLAADCVTYFDEFRAPLSEADRARRLQSNLSPVQTAYLERWGYPYVLDEFRFHMTLTGRLPVDRRAEVRQALTRLYSALDGPTTVDAISVCVQPTRDSRFVVLRRMHLSGG